VSEDAPGARALVRGVLRSSVVFDWSQARPLSALRRAAVMAAAMVVAWLVSGVAAAISASVAALLIGLLDRRQSPPARFRTMMAGTLLLTVSTLVARTLGPWPVAVLVLLVGIAFAEGVGIAVHRDAPLVMQLSGIVVATALLEPQDPASAVAAAVTVLLAGSAQTAVGTAAAYRARTVLEVEVSAAAIDHLARAIRIVAAVAGSAETTTMASEAATAMEQAARALSAAQRKVLGSDLSTPERDLLDQALFAADRMRIDARATLIECTGSDPGRRRLWLDASERLLRLADVLDAGCKAVRGTAATVDDTITSAGTDAASPEAEDPVLAFNTAVAGIVAVGRWRRVSTRPPGEQRRALRHGLQIGAVPFRFGSRLAVAASVSGLVGAAAGLVHGSWTINAGLSVLRPDGGATLPRLVRRAGGTTIGALIVLVEATVIGQSRVALAVAAIAFALVMYWLGPTNYGLYGMFVTVSVLSLLALTSTDPQAMALARWADTLIGCLVALVVAFLIPVWTVTRLPADVAQCGATTARRFRALAMAARQSPDVRDVAGLRVAGIATRDAISDVLTTLHVSTSEPATSVPVAELRATFEDLRVCARAGLVAEHLLTRGAPPSVIAAAAASDTAVLLDRLAGSLGGEPTMVADSPAVSPTPGPTGNDNAGLDAALRQARELAQRALASAPTAGPAT
jgi:hypothetical protein